MALIKTAEEIEKLKEGGVLLSSILRKIASACKAGVTTESFDELARKEFECVGGTPSFLNYQIGPEYTPYPSALCISINEEVVHGIASSDRIIADGDIVGLDIGMWYKGLATDMATTVIVGDVTSEVRALVADTRESLVRALSVVKAGALVGEIGATIEDFLLPKKIRNRPRPRGSRSRSCDPRRPADSEFSRSTHTENSLERGDGFGDRTDDYFGIMESSIKERRMDDRDGRRISIRAF